jgi:hypothetical protein
MKNKLFNKIKPNAKKYIGEEIVQVRIIVDPKSVAYPLIEGKDRGRSMDQIAVSIFTEVYRIGETKNGDLELMEDKKRRALTVNYYLDNLDDGKLKITLGLIELITKLMLSKTVNSTPLNGISYAVFKQRVLNASKNAKKSKNASKNAKKSNKKKKNGKI